MARKKKQEGMNKWVLMLLGMAIGFLAGWFLFGYVGVADALEIEQCQKLGSECGISADGKPCCVGLVCEEFNPHSGNYKCQEPDITPIPTPAPKTPYAYADTTCGSATINFFNPTKWLFVFDYRVDGEPAVDVSPWAGLQFNSSSPLYPGYFGDRWHLVEINGVGNKDVVIPFGEDTGTHTVEWRLAEGAEQDWYFDWQSVEVESDCEEPEPTPEPEPEPSKPEGCTENCGVPACTDAEPDPVVNPHVYRKGDCAIVKWMNADGQGDKVNIYWKENSSDGWQHALAEVENSGWREICGLGNADITFGIQSVNGCMPDGIVNASDMAVIVDGATNGWVLFR